VEKNGEKEPDSASGADTEGVPSSTSGTTHASGRPLLPSPTDAKPSKVKKVLGWVVAGVVAAALVVVTILVVEESERNPSTDDAAINARFISVAPQATGHIVELHVRENQTVDKGDLLFVIDDRPYKLARDLAAAGVETAQRKITLAKQEIEAAGHGVKAAKANIDVFAAALDLSNVTLGRIKPLAKEGYVTEESLDTVETARRQAIAGLNAAKQLHKQAAEAVPNVTVLESELAMAEATLAQAELQLEYTRVHAPFSGKVVNCNIAAGAFALPGIPVFTLIDTERWYVRANFREGDLKRMKLGMPATVRVMVDPDREFEGTIDSIAWGVQGQEVFELISLPLVRNTLDWVHLAQRFPVNILVKDPKPEHFFRIGASAAATVHLEGKTESKR